MTLRTGISCPHRTMPVCILAAMICCTPLLYFGSLENASAVSCSDNPPADTASQSNEKEEESPLLYETLPLSQFRISELSPQISTDMDYVDVFYSEWEDCRYIFLPSTADRSRLVISYAAKANEKTPVLYLDDTAVSSGAQTDLLATKDVFTLRIGETEYGEIRVMQSDLGCIYLHTAKGGLDYLDANKSYTETGSTLMLDKNGAVQYQGNLENIKSHGNSSWDYSPRKHPYNIKLAEKADLYGMGKAKKWVLLSNFLDFSQLRNTIAFEAAKAAGIEYTTDYVYVDLFADGSYRGTYQLTERVQIQKNRVNITDLEEDTEKLNDKPLKEYPHVAVGAEINQYLENSYKYYEIPNDPADITGGYLVQFQLWNRYPNDTESGFVTSRGQAVDIRCPQYASKAQVEYMRNYMQALEDAIYSEDGYNSEGKHYSDYIDMDSLLCYYLMEEFTSDADGTYASFYFYKETDAKGDGKLHCAPVWDFDLGFMNFARLAENSKGDASYTTKIDALYITCFPINGWDKNNGDGQGSENTNTVGVSWIGKLYEREDIVKRIAELYYEHYDSYLKQLSDTKQNGGALITQWGAELACSAEMNNAKTHMYGGRAFRGLGPEDGTCYPETVEFVRNCVEKRRNGLRKIWLKPFAQARLERLETEYLSLNLENYDEAGQENINQIMTIAANAITEAADMDSVEAAYTEALRGLQSQPHALLLGDFNDDRSVDIKDAQDALMYYGRRLVGYNDVLTSSQQQNGDVDGNGKQDAVDAMHILRSAASLRIGQKYLYPVENPS